MRAARRLLLWAALLAGCGGGRSASTAIQVAVHLGEGAPARVITSLRVTVEDSRRSATRDFAKGDRPLDFPVTFGVELGADVAGPVRLEVRGLDAAGRLRARDIIESLKVAPGELRQVSMVYLKCAGDCPAPDGGVRLDAAIPDGVARDGSRDGTADGAAAVCGNGKVDPGETCDVAVAASRPGACPPPACDPIPCTTAQRRGSLCTAACTYTETTAVVSGDRCCPRNATSRTDPDCSATCGNGAIEQGETCDMAIGPGRTGACPTEATCSDRDACTRDLLVSANTCSARCVHVPITTFGADGCCPPGGTSTNDPDCPRVCGNGVLEPPDELCDTGIPSGQGDACPTTCNDGNNCTDDMLEGSGCRVSCKRTPITQYISGDRCCPPGGNRNVDSDCQPVCGNAVVEANEACDREIPMGRPGACPAACPPAGACVPRALQGSARDCTARCIPRPITACLAAKDGCCPAGCNASTDGDCSPTCGNGVVEPGETCDTAIGSGTGACPRACDDGNKCTADQLVSGGTCNARCEAAPITTFSSTDGCCPPGGNNSLDGDCPAACGNSVVEAPKETCDKAIEAGIRGACPTACPPPGTCKKASLKGDAETCTARCEAETITTCVAGDGCCPLGCNRNNDADCPVVCGNAVVEAGESCDKGITAGNPGACPASCDDGNHCTADGTSGRVEDCTRTCSHPPITACAVGDRCCPAGCTGMTDGDCAPVCGNSMIEKEETCDPPSSCPTTCADDDDPCTADRLEGTPLMCTAVCKHVPITTCSGQTTDRCCPTGCTAAKDVDCVAAPDAGP